ncbi:hypothetical protein DL93DRAFT_2079961 [Clavulina sp. PMI_390]|nr:hypothetical protein DL93DRAFT_2079961 [Clavulina sp. PMI_390]
MLLHTALSVLQYCLFIVLVNIYGPRAIRQRYNHACPSCADNLSTQVQRPALHSHQYNHPHRYSPTRFPRGTEGLEADGCCYCCDTPYPSTRSSFPSSSYSRSYALPVHTRSKLKLKFRSRVDPRWTPLAEIQSEE